MIKHGCNTSGGRTPEYRAWESMVQRCTNPKHAKWKTYGGRGIAVCDRWRSFAAFLEDMGLRPSTEHSLDRKDNDRGYEPGNCRWATRKEQMRNRTVSKLNAADAAAIRASTEPQGTIAARFRVSRAMVSRIRSGLAWVG